MVTDLAVLVSSSPAQVELRVVIFLALKEYRYVTKKLDSRASGLMGHSSQRQIH